MYYLGTLPTTPWDKPCYRSHLSGEQTQSGRAGRACSSWPSHSGLALRPQATSPGSVPSGFQLDSASGGHWQKMGAGRTREARYFSCPSLPCVVSHRTATTAPLLPSDAKGRGPEMRPPPGVLASCSALPTSPPPAWLFTLHHLITCIKFPLLP